MSGNLNIKNAGDKKPVALNKAVFLGEDFKLLWERVKYKTTFRVEFDVEALIGKCVEEIKNHLIVGKTKFIYEKASRKSSAVVSARRKPANLRTFTMLKITNCRTSSAIFRTKPI